LIIHEYLEGKLTNTFEVDLLNKTEKGIVFETWKFPPSSILHVYKMEGDERKLHYKEIGSRKDGDKKILKFSAEFY